MDYLSSGYRYGCEKLRLAFAKDAVKASRVWLNKRSDSLHGGLILHDGYVYGVGYDYRRWFCLNATTGKVKYRSKEINRGCLTFADGMIYTLDNRGGVSLVKPSPTRFDRISRFRVPRGGKGLFFAHPVVCGGRLYIRHADHLYAYDVRVR